MLVMHGAECNGPVMSPLVTDLWGVCSHGSLLLHPAGEDVAHGAAVLVKADVEVVGVDLGAVRHFEHRLEPDALLPCE